MSSNCCMRFLLVVCLCAAAGFSQEIANPLLHGAWVSDEAELLSGDEESRLNRLSSRIYTSTKAQIVVVTTGRVKERTALRGFAKGLFNTWKLGSAEANDGVLVLLSAQERAVEIVTGSGLTTRLPNDRLEVLIRERMTPLLRRGETGAALVEASKTIGAMLSGIDREHGAPEPALLLFSAILLIAGLAAATYAFLFWKQPMTLPPAGSFAVKNELQDLPLAKSWFVDAKQRNFFYRVGSMVKSAKDREFPVWSLWAATIGVGTGAGLLAGWILGRLRFDMEPSLWLAGLVVGVVAIAAPSIIYGPSQREFDGMATMAAWVAALSGIVGALALNRLMLSDFAISVYFVPPFVLAVAMIAAYFLIGRSRYWAPERFTCAECGKDLTDAKLEGALEPWQERAQEERLVLYRGWQCTGSCKGPFLAYMIRRDEDVCPKCQKPTNLITGHKGWRVLTCFLCGHESRQKLAKKAAQGAAGVYAASGSTYEPSSSGGSESTYDPRQYESSSYDPPPSGGSTEGSGASGNW